MKRTTYSLVALLLILAGFYAWHTPMGGPLTDAEIEAFISNQAASGGGVWSDDDAFEAFLRDDDGRPFIMINLMELNEVADYPDGSETEATEGADAEAAYGQAVFPLLLQRGSYPIARAERYETIINSLGQTAAEFDSFAMVRYRSRRDLIDMLSSDAFQTASVHKWASLENTLVAPSKPMPSFQFIGYLPYFILMIMAVIAGRALPRKNAQISSLSRLQQR